MLIAVGVVTTTLLIVANTFALAQILDDDLPSQTHLAWAVVIVLLPAMGAALWFSRRLVGRSEADPARADSYAANYPGRRDLERLHEEIDRYRSRSV